MKWMHKIFMNDEVIRTVITDNRQDRPKVWVSTIEYCEPGHIFLYDLDMSVRLYNILKHYLNGVSLPKSALTEIDFKDIRLIKGFGKAMEKELELVIKDVQLLP